MHFPPSKHMQILKGCLAWSCCACGLQMGDCNIDPSDRMCSVTSLLLSGCLSIRTAISAVLE